MNFLLDDSGMKRRTKESYQARILLFGSEGTED